MKKITTFTIFLLCLGLLSAQESVKADNENISEITAEFSFTDSTETYSETYSENSESSEKNEEFKNKNSDNNIESTTTDSEIKSDSEIKTKESTTEKPPYIALPYPGMDRPEVQKFRDQYLSPKWTQLLYIYLERGMEYRLYVRKSIQDKELPEILEYLPIVESNYITTAKSSSGAIGMWQFMANSVYPFLELNDFVDQRLDPWKSTDAALKKLTDNYNYFGDWLIAIGAYNCGIGAMNKAIKKAGTKDFWELVESKALSGQTANYVPKLLAIADLAINAEYYGIDIPNHNEEFEYLSNEKEANFDYITVSNAYSLAQLAQEIRLDQKTMNRLNPSYITGMTHPSKKSDIRLPLGMKESAEAALKKMEPIDFPFKYTVVAGDSLWSISRRYGISVQSICDINGIKENAILRIGKTLYIPAKKSDD